MHVYVNGQLRPEVEVEGDWPEANPANFSASLELGRFLIGSTLASGTVLMDELLIWEVQLPCDDVIRLYQSYP